MLFNNIKNFKLKIIISYHYFTKTLKMIIGIPDYENYLLHMKNKHPNIKPMNYEEFFKNRQISRYGSNGVVKCC
ncbi:hypothetical protein CKSOR_00329 [Candidatus Kinetoplastibacterium sorsogonicusi]|uniref:YbdD/YjiX family protein n=1 Tax=Candidatus Kinetoplastidibacterium kentomonadis TaxID=1576550 RepID=A0A3S7J9V4_9PROT|nr:CstA-like transporter-associated (seleno)protein [Candidatus Kinetoplastibacterium sorsogonicusi]AWD32450.1 hypothetical protein CKSOR_00329 [Candidatus Kinetoplastibacterium sorsogonicusi]